MESCSTEQTGFQCYITSKLMLMHMSLMKHSFYDCFWFPVLSDGRLLNKQEICASHKKIRQEQALLAMTHLSFYCESWWKQ